MVESVQGVGRGSGHGPSWGKLPVYRMTREPHLMARLAALWHRERAYEEYVASGWSSGEARAKTNQEALEIALHHGWRGNLADLKRQLADLLDTKPSERHPGDTRTYWEDALRREMRRLLGLPATELRKQLRSMLETEVLENGDWSGPVGMYKLAFLIGFVPPIEHIEKRNAFIEALSEFGNDPQCCDEELYRVVFRLSRRHTLVPFEARVGFSMPGSDDRARPTRKPGLAGRLTRWIVGSKSASRTP